MKKFGINIRANRDDRGALAYTIREVGINTKIALKTHRRIVWWGIWLLLLQAVKIRFSLDKKEKSLLQ
ncbi:hypothetical protein [Carnobacterium maltaromaticum]|jgi:hypothetical protein|uniref:hypothetical protein n=1 Tax=Carnobacterium maltaromaticum TaxID=2751 RepID=UPI000550F82C|nr:hypothetical protein [Carnobacterium maltaromaticum]AOA03483.1 hypothetical protein BFC23_13640 [Carnobacterium maltaromaticum]MCI1818092.1 hypothetical protein [Carnobacterium maltaromaticum]